MFETKPDTALGCVGGCRAHGGSSGPGVVLKTCGLFSNNY